MKPIYLLDTNIISEFTKISPNQKLLENVSKREELCSICSTVWEEAVYGYERMPEGRKQEEFPVYEGKHEAIISEEVWEIVREKRKTTLANTFRI